MSKLDELHDTPNKDTYFERISSQFEEEINKIRSQRIEELVRMEFKREEEIKRILNNPLLSHGLMSCEEYNALINRINKKYDTLEKKIYRKYEFKSLNPGLFDKFSKYFMILGLLGLLSGGLLINEYVQQYSHDIITILDKKELSDTKKVEEEFKKLGFSSEIISKYINKIKERPRDLINLPDGLKKSLNSNENIIKIGFLSNFILKDLENQELKEQFIKICISNIDNCNELIKKIDRIKGIDGLDKIPPILLTKKLIEDYTEDSIISFIDKIKGIQFNDNEIKVIEKIIEIDYLHMPILEKFINIYGDISDEEFKKFFISKSLKILQKKDSKIIIEMFFIVMDGTKGLQLHTIPESLFEVLIDNSFIRSVPLLKDYVNYNESFNKSLNRSDLGNLFYTSLGYNDKKVERLLLKKNGLFSCEKNKILAEWTEKIEEILDKFDYINGNLEKEIKQFDNILKMKFSDKEISTIKKILVDYVSKKRNLLVEIEKTKLDFRNKNNSENISDDIILFKIEYFKSRFKNLENNNDLKGKVQIDIINGTPIIYLDENIFNLLEKRKHIAGFCTERDDKYGEFIVIKGLKNNSDKQKNTLIHELSHSRDLIFRSHFFDTDLVEIQTEIIAYLNERMNIDKIIYQIYVNYDTSKFNLIFACETVRLLKEKCPDNYIYLLKTTHIKDWGKLLDYYYFGRKKYSAIAQSNVSQIV